MKVILDSNIWISFLLGYQVQLVRRILTDLCFDVYVCPQLIEEIRCVASRKKISKYLRPTDLIDLLDIINAYCHKAEINKEVPMTAVRDPKDLYLLALAETIDADYIISGDADLTDIGCYKHTCIIKLTDFKSILD